MKKNIIISIIIFLGIIGYLIYATVYEKNPFAIQLIIVFTILLILGIIVSIISYFFPNSKLTKFLKKIGEWIGEGF